MKEATGDMTMTIVVIVGIIAVLALGTGVIWPIINGKIQKEVNNISTENSQINGAGYIDFSLIK